MRNRRDDKPGADEEVAFHAHGLGDEEVAFHAHYGGDIDEGVAVHVRYAPLPERGPSDDLDEVTTAPVNRSARADREIAQFVSLLDRSFDLEHAARSMDISHTPTTSRRDR